MFVISKKRSFTLAEVLITLTLIGVVAAMSIPNLISNIEDAKYSSMAKNKVAQLNQVFKKIATENGGTLKGVFALNAVNTAYQSIYYSTILSPYLNYKTLCKPFDINLSENCWNKHGDWATYNGSATSEDVPNFYNNNSGFALNDGSFLVISGSYYGYSSSASYGTWINNYNADRYHCFDGGTYSGQKDTYLAMMVDLDGKAGPNRLGKDIHILFVNEHGNIITHENCTYNDIYGVLRIRYYLYGFEEFK